LIKLELGSDKNKIKIKIKIRVKIEVGKIKGSIEIKTRRR